MDQSKWALPRQRNHTLTKSMQKMERPRVKLQGAWAHGVCLALEVISVRQSCDGAMVAETLSVLLDHVKRICDSKGKAMPKKVVLWVVRLQDGFWAHVKPAGRG